MKAVLFKRTGSVDGLVLADLPVPVPAPDEVLVRVHATTVTRGDVVLRKMPFVLARLFGQRRKTMLGHEYAGEVVGAGAQVAVRSVGDRVFGTTTGLATGSYAEFICVPVDGRLTTIPSHRTFEDAAPVPVGAMTAWRLLRRGDARRDQRVLVVGASGSVGTYAVQLAVHLGAQVTAVCRGRHAELMRSLGAMDVIDYQVQDVTRGRATYDVIVDAVGTGSIGDLKRIRASGGSVVSVRSSLPDDPADLDHVRALLDAGAIRAVIDRRYPLDEIQAAHAYVETGHKVGNVLITVSP